MIGVALAAEVARRDISQNEAAGVLGVSKSGLSHYIAGRTTPTIDPRTLAAFLHHDDGREWTVEEVLDALAKDREARRGS